MAQELPTGTVTFLFTDIEGSTRLLDELGDRYAELLAEHHRLMRESFEPRGGVEVDTQGDAFFVAFRRASDCVEAASVAQEALEPTGLRVRMGIHTGEPLLTDTGYVGMDVHRAARVMSAGHGGQVLISQTTRDLLDNRFELRDLGAQRLKDLSAPQRLFQLGNAEFPPLKTLHQTNLPVQPTPLIGREEELAHVLALLSEARLVTLTGAGGSGKTRLALQASADLVDSFDHGVWWVPLAALRDAALVESTIAQVVGGNESLAGSLRPKQLLLLLDNFEQLLEAAPLVASLLAEAPELRVLTTSRERLGIAGEHEYLVPTMAAPEAAALFTARARQTKPDFEPDDVIMEICRRLDGLPLAIELAAARIKVLRPQQILDRLGQSLNLLTAGTRDAPERHQALRATIEWSYELLDDAEGRLFASLAVFAGSFDLDAAEAVCEADLAPLAGLVDKSLLRQTDDGRFFMLETIREYAVERLGQCKDSDALRQRHAEWFAQLAAQGEPEMRRASPDNPWPRRFEQEHGNFRAALGWLLASGEVEFALRLAGSLLYFWWVHGHVAEGRRWIEEGLGREHPIEASVRAKALSGASYFALLQGDLNRAKVCAEESLELFETLGDDDGVTRALNELALVATDQGDFDGAKALYEKAIQLARSAGANAATLTLNLAEVAYLQGSYEDAARLCDDALAEARETDNGWAVVQAQLGRGLADFKRDRVAEAGSFLTMALEESVEIGFVAAVADCLEGLAAVLAASGDARRALLLLGATAELRRTHGETAAPRQEDLRQGVLLGVQGQFDEEVTTQLLDEGRAMGLDEAVALALQR